MKRVKAILFEFQNELKSQYNKSEVEAIFYRLLFFYHNIERIDISLNPNISIDSENLEKALERLKKNEPWQYIINETEFYSLKFKVNADVLIPRPETEELVHWILEDLQNKSNVKILDLGTGSGAIAISLAKNIPNVQITAIDISSNAIQLAKKNAQFHQVDINFKIQNILENFSCEEKFDIIVSNPPYVRNSEKNMMKNNVLDFEPLNALFVKDENPLIFYDKIIDIYSKNSREGGKLYFEINEFLKEEMYNLLFAKQISSYEFKKDLFGKWRMLKIG